MVKKVTVTFDYDPTTDEVLNVKTHVEGEVKTARKTKAKPKESGLQEDSPIVIREENKLVFNNNAIDLMQAEVGDRIYISYNKDSHDGVYPQVSISDQGNKLTQGLTIAFRGKNNEILADYGEIFTLEPDAEGIFKLISDKVPTQLNTVSVDSPEEAIQLAEDTELGLYIDNDDNSFDISELSYKF